MSGAGRSELTFLFTDVEGSTRMWETAPATMRDDLAVHDRLLADVVRDHRGTIFKFRGDGVAAVFTDATDAVAAAVAAQRRLAAEPWTGGELRVRMGLHSGEAIERDGDWFGPTVNRTARLHDVAHGGQIVLSARTAGLVTEELPADVELLDLGEHRLRDLAQPEQIHQVAALDLAGPFPPLRTEHQPGRGVPAAVGRLLGQAGPRRRLDEIVRARRLVTITGPPGVGKTRLVLEVARGDRAAWPGGVWFCALAPLPHDSPADAVATRLGDLLRPNAADELMSALDAVVGALSDRRALVVLDGAEHVLSGVTAVVTELLDSCPHVAVVVTSRERLGLADEQLLDLPTLSETDAVALFDERARAVRADFRLAEHHDAVRSLIEQLDGLPLAIELAAARVRTHAPAQIDALLRDHLRVLRSPRQRRDASSPRPDSGHHDLDLAIAWSYDQLDDAEQAAFRALGAFAGSCAAADLAQLLPGVDLEASTDLLDGLVDRSLVALAPPRAWDRATRYRLLAPLRAYARRQLDAASDGRTVRERHTTAALQAITEAASRLSGADEARWVRSLADRWEDARAIQQRAVAEGDAATATALVAPLLHHSTMRGLEVAAWAGAAVELPDFWAQPGAIDVACLAAEGRMRLSDLDGARALAEEAIRRSSAAPGCSAWHGHSTLSLITFIDGDIVGGFDHLAQMEAAYRRVEVDAIVPAIHGYLTASVFTYGGLWAEAIQAVDEVRRVAQTTGCPSIEAMADLAEGRARTAEAPALARPTLERALELAASVDNVLVAAQARFALAELESVDDPAGALERLSELLDELRRAGDDAQSQQALLRSIGPLLSLGLGEPARLAAAVLDTPTWDRTVLHKAAVQRLAVAGSPEDWVATRTRAKQLGLQGVVDIVLQAADAPREGVIAP